MLSAAICAILLGARTETTLVRKFTTGEKDHYEVRSTLQAERRGGALRTFIPEDYEFSYRFSTEVIRMLADGIAEVRYRRPTLTEILGETHDRPPRRRVENLDLHYILQLSPINEILDAKQVKPSANPKRSARRSRQEEGRQQEEETVIGRFIGELYRLTLFIGSLDSGLDLSPKLPLDPVAIGESWKRTIGYSPQKLGQGNRSAVQRIDLTYTYVGPMTVSGRKIERIRATAALETDVAPFVNQALGPQRNESELKSVLLKLNAQIDFDLDPATMKTLLATAISEANISIVANGEDEREADYEERLKGRTTMLRLPSES